MFNNSINNNLYLPQIPQRKTDQEIEEEIRKGQGKCEADYNKFRHKAKVAANQNNWDDAFSFYMEALFARSIPIPPDILMEVAEASGKKGNLITTKFYYNDAIEKYKIKGCISEKSALLSESEKIKWANVRQML